MNELAAILAMRGQFDRVLQVFSDTVTLLESSDCIRKSPHGGFQYTRAHRLYSSLSLRTGLDNSLDLQAGTFRFKRNTIGIMLRLRKGNELAAANVAIQSLENIQTIDTDDYKILAELARAFRTKAKSRTQQHPVSETSIRRAINLLEKVAHEHPRSYVAC